jgi:hypothetical protein
MFNMTKQITAMIFILAAGLVWQSRADAGITVPKASSDSVHTSYQFSYSGTGGKFFQIFLDTDQNSITGYRNNGIGAEFLLENGSLSKYIGSGTNWVWQEVKKISYNASSGTFKWSLAKTDIGSPSNLKFFGQVVSRKGSGLATSRVVFQSLPTPTPTPTPGPISLFNYSVNPSPIPNPERGFYAMYDCVNSILSAAELKTYRDNEQITVFICNSYLTTFRNSPISQAALDTLQTNMNTVRSAGMKIGLRFSYTQNEIGDDATPSRVLSHLDQLAPFFAKNKDVIYVIQAGFIGTWGEWGYTQNWGNWDNITAQDWANRKILLDKILSVVPDRMIQVRTPEIKMKAYGSTALSSSEAFSGTARARVGQHNDCFLANSTDAGTYINTAVEYPWLQAESKYLPVGGETCAVNTSRASCTTALSELSKFHWSYLNLYFNSAVIDGFKSGGCFNEIKSRLGYKFVLKSGSFSSTARVGGQVQFNMTLENQGFAAPFNPRKVELILRNTSSNAVYRIALNEDPRLWIAGSTINVSQALNLPANLPAGSYALLLNLPDPETSLYGRPEYSIQLANLNTWEPSTGFNKLGQTLVVAP